MASRSRSTAAGLVVGAGLTVLGCGSSQPPRILDTEKVERAIEGSILAQRQQRARVSCPAGVQQRKGLVFFCTALVARRSTRFVVTQRDAAGHVFYEAR